MKATDLRILFYETVCKESGNGCDFGSTPGIF